METMKKLLIKLYCKYKINEKLSKKKNLKPINNLTIIFNDLFFSLKEYTTRKRKN